jgi:hypothetical protein
MSSIAILTWIGLFAAALQALGYLAYVTQVLKKEIRPNAASWTMFAYGTSLLVVLEWDRGAAPLLLAFPALCAFCSVCVAIYCRYRGGKLWPKHVIDRMSFVLDLMITVAYVAGWVLLSRGNISDAQKETIDLALLVCWNIGILTAFFPLLREVYHHPHSERSLPWVIWASAYALLALVTILTEGEVNELILYPLINMMVHGFVAHHAREHRRLRLSTRPS